jgi:DNA helicase-2/ATP-dependent DNA helicase PcrA
MTVTGPQSLLDSLDDDQRTAAASIGRPVAVIAGPGTGKTRTLVHRLAYGMASRQIDPTAALAVTFTTRAAGELRSRLAEFGATVQARTFHSAALAQAQYFWPLAYGSNLPRVCESPLRLVNEVLPRFGWVGRPGLGRELVQAIAWTKQTNVLPEDYSRRARAAGRRVAGLDDEQVVDLLCEYERVKQGLGLIDFDDILLCAAAVLEESEEAARQMARRCAHLVVDEFQDVSPIQSRLIDLWQGPHEDICVVGDPAQTIHGFAGARSDYLENFALTHPRCRTVTLTHNHRSTPPIVGVANAIMRGHGGVVLTSSADPGPGVTWSEEPDAATEAAGAAVWLAGLSAAGLAWSDMAVLYRGHSQAERVVRALRARSIPCRVIRPADQADGDESGGLAGSGENAVTCCTLHSAKGREWPAVAVVGVQEGALPHSRAGGASALAEERRLLYVGVTRAQRHLLVSWARIGPYGGRVAPSRFLVESGLV